MSNAILEPKKAPKKKASKTYDSSELKICPYCSAALKKSRSRCKECHRLLPLSKFTKIVIAAVIVAAVAAIVVVYMLFFKD